MKISTKGRYGTRAMIDIGENHDKGPVSLRDLAARQGLSMKYMEQILPALKAAGLVKSSRGARGGYVLAKSAHDITLKEIIQALEGSWSLVDCLDDKKRCPRSEECVTYDIWNHIHEAIHRILQSTTLEDMISMSREKQKKGPPVACPFP